MMRKDFFKSIFWSLSLAFMVFAFQSNGNAKQVMPSVK